MKTNILVIIILLLCFGCQEKYNINETNILMNKYIDSFKNRQYNTAYECLSDDYKKRFKQAAGVDYLDFYYKDPSSTEITYKEIRIENIKNNLYEVSFIRSHFEEPDILEKSTDEFEIIKIGNKYFIDKQKQISLKIKKDKNWEDVNR